MTGRNLKALIRPAYKKAQSLWARTIHGFSPVGFTRLLHNMGVQKGDALLVHAAFRHFTGFSGGVPEAISALQSAAGEDGLVLMPTLPFGITVVEWAEQGHVFDVRKTPSVMGVLSESFRLSEGVTRSVHPTHPAAVWGRGAKDLIAGHHLAGTPCGAGSPYARLLERSAKMAFLGVDIDTMTFYHAPEELYEAEMPFTPFTRQTYTMQSLDWDGNRVETVSRLFDPVYSRKRKMVRLTPYLKKMGFLEGRKDRPVAGCHARLRRSHRGDPGHVAGRYDGLRSVVRLAPVLNAQTNPGLLDREKVSRISGNKRERQAHRYRCNQTIRKFHNGALLANSGFEPCGKLVIKTCRRDLFILCKPQMNCCQLSGG